MKHTFEKIKIDREKKAREKRKNRAWKAFAGIFLLAQGISSGYAFYRAYTLGMLPGKLLFMFGGLLLVLFFLNYLLFFAGVKANGARAFRRSIAVILALAIGSGCFYAGNFMRDINSTVDEITVTDKETVAATMNVYVVTRDRAVSLSDCKNYSFGVVGGNDGAASFAAITKIKTELGSELSDKSYESISGLAEALYKGEIGAAVIDTNYVEILKETEKFADFDDKAKFIATVNITPEELSAAEASHPYQKGPVDKPVEIAPATGKVNNVDIEPFIVYISGSDTRDKMFKVSRSDVNILMVVNPQTKQILLLNTPRDYYIPNPRSSYGTKDKLTHLGIYGVDCSITGLENLYGVDINYYVQINFTGTETLIDDIGGVSINNPQSFSARGYNFPAGDITLNGPQAVVYARERYAFTTGDNMRGQNQMRLITAIIKKLTSPSAEYIIKYKAILTDLQGFIVTNMESDEIDALVKMQLNDLASWNVKSYAVTGTGGSDITYSMPGQNLYVTYPDQDSVNRGAALVNKVLTGGTLTDEDVG